MASELKSVMMLSKSLRSMLSIQQALHGYRDGHRLLESSTALSNEAKSTLLGLSDMSGPSIVSGFEDYVTGYPLTEAGLYALAATWYAPEMERPGCVWTHTLLIDFSDLAAIQDLSFLQSYFVRPSNSEDFSRYKQPLEIRAAAHDEIVSEPIVGALSLVNALYSQEAPVLCGTDNSEKHLRLVFRIWGQQWPKLRRAFKFCTGALSPRRLKGADFDLQLFPTRSRSRFSRTSGVFVDTQQPGIGPSFEAWVEVVAADLQFGRWSDLRQFFYEYGPEVEGGRVSLRSLTRTYLAIGSAPVAHHSDGLFRVLAEEFPTPDSAIRLKKAVLSGKVFSNEHKVSVFDTKAALDALLNPVYGEAFDSLSDEARLLAMDSWKHHGMAARSILWNAIGNPRAPISAEIVSGVASVISPADIEKLASEDASIVPMLVASNRKLASYPQAWTIPPHRQEQVFLALGPLEQLTEKDLTDLLGGVLHAYSYWVVYRLAEKRPAYVVPAVLDWIDQQQRGSAELLQFQELLQRHKKLTEQWLSEVRGIREHTLALILSAFSFEAAEISCPLNVWAKLAEASTLWDADILIRSKAALLALALRTSSAAGANLAATSFEPVHISVEHGHLPWRSWEQLRPLLPDVPWFKSWDKAERLRQALIDSSISHGWPKEAFLKALRNGRILELLLRSDALTHIQRNFLKDVARAIQNGNIEADPIQRELLGRFDRRPSWEFS